MTFSRPVMRVDAPDGLRSPSGAGESFMITNRSYNGYTSAGLFYMEFTMHFDRNQFKKKDVKVAQVRFDYGAGLVTVCEGWFHGIV